MRLARRPRPPYKLLSLLLLYPDDELIDARGLLVEEIRRLPAIPERPALAEFGTYLESAQPTELRQRYVETFDLQRRSSLYLTFYSDGDTRKRGQALLRLKRLYSGAGLELEAGELPDFLPVLLEFAELAPPEAGPALLSEHRAGLELLRLSLEELESPYRHLLKAVCARLPRPGPQDLDELRRLIREGPPSEQVGLQPFAPPEVMPPLEPAR